MENSRLYLNKTSRLMPISHMEEARLLGNTCLSLAELDSLFILSRHSSPTTRAWWTDKCQPLWTPQAITTLRERPTRVTLQTNISNRCRLRSQGWRTPREPTLETSLTQVPALRSLNNHRVLLNSMQALNRTWRRLLPCKVRKLLILDRIWICLCSKFRARWARLRSLVGFIEDREASKNEQPHSI